MLVGCNDGLDGSGDLYPGDLPSLPKVEKFPSKNLAEMVLRAKMRDDWQAKSVVHK